MPLVKEPAVTLEGVKVRALTLSTLNLDVNLRVENPNLFGVTLRDLPLTVSCLAGGTEHQIATGNGGRVKIRGNGSTAITIPVAAHNAGIFKAVTSFVAQGGIEVVVRGTAYIDCVVVCRPVPFMKSIRLTTAQLTDAVKETVAKKKE